MIRMMSSEKTENVEGFRNRLDEAEGYGEVYGVVKDTVQRSLGMKRVGMMLFIDDLPLQLGAYHPVGSNNMILNRTLVQIVESATKSKRVINSFVYSILLHEYLHALGYLQESEVRPLVYQISREIFGINHIATQIAKKGPWSILKGIPLNEIKAPKRIIQVVKDFEKTNRNYIV
jgi:hypothetical protein